MGSQGVPAKYGGFETLAEYLTLLLNKKVDFTVYCSSKSYAKKLKTHNNASLVYIPLSANGIQSIPYDIISLFLAARKSDTILILGVSGCIALPIFRLFYPKKRLLINIDGLEHQRDKWKESIRKFLKYSEKLAVKYANEVIADNKAIQEYIKTEYNKESTLIAYGGNHASKIPLEKSVKQKYSLPDVYAFKVCRIEPENNIRMILEAFSLLTIPIVIVGNWDNSEYGKSLKEEYKNSSTIFLLDPIYEQNILDQIRSNCKLYIHGHSAGGTNPSLVEAMYLGLPVIAFNVSYNQETTFNQAIYFSNAEELSNLVNKTKEKELKNLGNKMKEIATKEYTWETISEKYAAIF